MPRPQFKNIPSSIEEIIRVDHAGEYGAVEIYSGQLKYIKDNNARSLIEEMCKGEKIHLQYFEKQIKKRNIRPTIMIPLWKFLGKSLGVISSIGGTKLAMALTESVESVIDNHYDHQLSYLKEIKKENDLVLNIEKFKQDELDHKHIAISNGSKEAPIYRSFSIFVKSICKLSIAISKKL